MATVRYHGFVISKFEQPTKSIVFGLYRGTKFRWNRCSTFDNMPVLIFIEFGLKMPINAPK